MSESSNPRPTHATLAGWLTILASVFLVVSLFTSIGSLRSLENRRTWEEALAEPGLGQLGLGVDDLLTTLYVLSLVAAACATASAVLGVFALRGDRQARLALSILAVPLFVSGFLTGGLLSAVVAVAVVMMWLQPSRDWFAGRKPAARPEAPRQQPPAPERETSRSDLPGGPPTGSPAPGAPQPWGRPAEEPTPGRAYEGYGGAGPATLAAERPEERPDHQLDPWARPLPSGPGHQGAGPRPLGVVLACVSTWVFSALMVLTFGIGIAAAAISPQDLTDQVIAQDPTLADQGVTPGLVVTAAAVVGGFFIVWSLAAMVLAAFAFRGANGARVTLVVSAAVVAVPGILIGFFAPLLLPVALAAVVTLVGLLRSDARAWYAARSSASRGPSGGLPPGAPGPWS